MKLDPKSGLYLPKPIRRYSPEEQRRAERKWNRDWWRPRLSFSPIETVTATFSGTTIVLTFGTATTGGELIVFHLATGENGNIPTLVTDNQSQVYTSVYSVNIGGHWRTSLYYVANSASGVTTITITPNSDTHGGAIAQHYKGIATTSPLDKNGGTPASSSAWSSATTSALSVSGELAIGTCWAEPGTASTSISPSGSWTQDATITTSNAFDGSNGLSMALAHYTVAGTSGIANTGTNPTGGVGTVDYAGIATFKPSGGGGGSPLFLNQGDLNGMGVGGPFFKNPIG